jgi:hypothetical protein
MSGGRKAAALLSRTHPIPLPLPVPLPLPSAVLAHAQNRSRYIHP